MARAAATLTHVAHVYFQPRGEGAAQVDVGYERPLGPGDPDRFQLVAGAEWAPLRDPVLVGPRVVYLKNEEGRWPERLPTKAERAAAALRVVEVSFDGVTAAVEVRPQEAVSIPAVDASSLAVRCRSETARLTAVVFPEG